MFTCGPAFFGSGGQFGPQFTVPVPTSLTGWVSGVAPDLTTAQAGSRLIYIGPSGTEVTNTATARAKLYFWNGTNIVDASGFTSPGGTGTLYGTDPFNPTLPAAGYYKRWSSVAPRNDASDIGSLTGIIGANGSGGTGPAGFTRAGKPDWYMFQRGQTFDLNADITAWNAASGGSQILHCLMTQTGKSASERCVGGTWGALTTARPAFKNVPAAAGAFFATNIAGWNFVLITGWKFDGSDRSVCAPQSMDLLVSTTAERDVNFEDCWWDRCAAQIAVGSGSTVETQFGGVPSSWHGGIRFEGCIISNTWVAGVGCSGIYHGGAHYDSRITMKSCVFLRNGHEQDPTTKATYSPDGTVWAYGGNALKNHNFYLSGGTDSGNSFVKDNVSIVGASGAQWRSGGYFEGNFMYEGYFSLGFGSGYPPSTAVAGSCLNNVLQRFAPLTDGAGGVPINVPGWGYQVGGGAYGIEVAYNIYSQAQHGTIDSSGIGYGIGLSWFIDDADTPTNRATTNMNIHHNILDGDFTDIPSIFQEIDGANNTELGWPGVMTGWGTAPDTGTVLTCTPLTGYTGTPSYQWMKDTVDIAGQTSATYTMVAGDKAAVSNGIRCRVTGISYAAGTSPALKTNTIANNISCISGGATNLKRLALGTYSGVTNASVTDTTYTTNTTYGSLALAKAGQSWLDETRTLKKWLQSKGVSVSSTDGASEYDAAVTAMWRGSSTFDRQYFSGKAINNYIRAGRNMSLLT